VCHLPLAPGGEACAAAAPEPGGQDGVDDLLRGLLSEGAAQGLIAAGADVLVNVLGVDDAAVAQRDAELILIELGFGEAGHLLGGVPLLVQQPLDDAALDDVLGDDLRRVVRGHVGVKSPLGIDEDHRAHGAQSKTAGLDHPCLLLHALGLQLPLKGLNDLGTVGGGAAGAGADQDMGTDKIHL